MNSINQETTHSDFYLFILNSNCRDKLKFTFRTDIKK